MIRALNEAEHLPALYQGIALQTRVPDEVILVDSGSSDATVLISQNAGAKVVYIPSADFSFGRALNVGCEAAIGDVLVFVSAHVYPVDKHWLENLVAPFESHSEVALVYGKQTGDERSAFSEIQVMRRWFPDSSNRDQETPFCNNANCAIRTSVWVSQAYDEKLTGLEDMHWAKAALADGHRLWYEASAEIVHLHDESYSQTVNRYRREAIAHKRIFGAQKMGAIEAIWLFVANTARDYLASVPRRRLFRDFVSIPRFRFAQFRGSWQGFRDDADPTAEMKRHFYYPKGFTARSQRRPPQDHPNPPKGT